MNKEIKEILDDLLFTTTLPNASVKLNKEKLKLLKDCVTNLEESEAYYYGQYKDYKSRIEKAVEYIKDWHQEYNGLMETNNIYIPKDKPSLFDLRNVLNGRSDE